MLDIFRCWLWKQITGMRCDFYISTRHCADTSVLSKKKTLHWKWWLCIHLFGPTVFVKCVKCDCWPKRGCSTYLLGVTGSDNLERLSSTNSTLSAIVTVVDLLMQEQKTYWLQPFLLACVILNKLQFSLKQSRTFPKSSSLRSWL